MANYICIGNKELRLITLRDIRQLRHAGKEVRELAPPVIVKGADYASIEEILDHYSIPRQANALLVGEGERMLIKGASSEFGYRKKLYPIVFYNLENK